MTTHLAVDIGSAFTSLVMHVHPTPGDRGRLVVFRARTQRESLQAGLHETLAQSGVAWPDVALVVCGSTLTDYVPAVQQAIAAYPFQGRVCFMQSNACLTNSPLADPRSAPASGMLAALTLSHLIGEADVLAVEVGASTAWCGLIRGGTLPRAQQAVSQVESGPPLVAAVKRHCEAVGLDPRDLTLMVYGGGGAARAVELAQGLGSARVIVPIHAAAFAAWGMLQADLRCDYVGECVPGDDVAGLFAQLRVQALKEARAHGQAEEDLRFEQLQEAQLCLLRVTVSITKPKLPIKTTTDRTIEGAYQHGGQLGVEGLEAGMRVVGPASLSGATGPWQVPADAVLTVDSYGNFVIEFNRQRRDIGQAQTGTEAQALNEAADEFRERVGCMLLTVTRVEPVRRATVIRVWSSHPTLYPVNATKPMDSDAWMSVVEQRRPVVCNEPTELDHFFPVDAELLRGLGCGSGINVPVFEANRLLGSINAFHQAGWFTPERVACAQRLAADFFRDTR
jgi:Hydantoinase/oxoprolinase/GAF domain